MGTVAGTTLISSCPLDLSGVIPWTDVWYLDISLGETGTGCFALWDKSEKHLIASDLGYQWPVWVKMEGGVLMRLQMILGKNKPHPTVYQ